MERISVGQYLVHVNNYTVIYAYKIRRLLVKQYQQGKMQQQRRTMIDQVLRIWTMACGRIPFVREQGYAALTCFSVRFPKKEYM